MITRIAQIRTQRSPRPASHRREHREVSGVLKRKFSASSVFLCALCVLATIGCGRKGPPLAPIVYLPRPVAELAAKRVENEVVVQFTVPTLNTDGTGPADLRRVEVYAHTGPLPTPADFLKYGTLVASIDIADPAEQTAEELQAATPKQGAESVAKADAAGTTQPPVSKQEQQRRANADAKLTKQGELISVREALTEKHKEIGPMPPVRPAPPPLPDAPVVETLETPGTVNFQIAPERFYTVFAVSESRGRRSGPAGPLRVPLVEPLMPPEKVDFGYTETAISLTWPAQAEDIVPASTPSTAAAPTPAPSVDPPLTQETLGTVELYADIETDDTRDVAPPPPTAAASAKPPARAAAAKAGPPSPRYGYNVYEVDKSTTPSASAPDRSTTDELRGDKPADTPSPPILPLNTALLTTTTFSDPRVEFDVERCYSIRRVEMSSGIAIEGPPTAPVCVTPVDTFPPAAPKNVQAISGGSGVSLLWEANNEPDFGGYLVLRAEAPDDKLSPLTPTPISDTSFNDTTVRRGRTYVYEVVAVDKSNPANRSAPSNRVEETIR